MELIADLSKELVLPGNRRRRIGERMLSCRTSPYPTVPIPLGCKAENLNRGLALNPQRFGSNNFAQDVIRSSASKLNQDSVGHILGESISRL